MVFVTNKAAFCLSSVIRLLITSLGSQGGNRKEIRAFGGFRPLVSDTAVEAKDFLPPAAPC